MGMFQLERHKRSSVLSALLSLSLFFTQGSSLVWAADSGTGTSDTEAVQAQTVSPDGSDAALDPEDLYIPDRLTKKMAVEVKGITTEGTNDITDKSEYSDPLKAGDLVVVYQLSDSKYVILDRVVSGDEV